MNNRKVVLYIRLSLEDSKSGSSSISTQEQILQKKLLDMPEYADCELVKLIDNGYSGTSFDRPSLNKLLEMVKCQEVACLLIKDFSRLGRDMSQVGYLTESVFPLFYTRLVSVTDGYDSNDHYESTGGLEVAFRFLMSEHYSKDLGRKISAAKQSKIQKGELVVKYPFYGYKLDENRKYIINEEVAENVRLIFKLAIDGLTLNQIVVRLQNEDILPPAAYKKKLNPNYNYSAHTLNVWSDTALARILRNVRYTGVYTKGTLRGVTKSMCEENGETFIENHHPAIISMEDYEKAQERFTQKKTFRNFPEYPMKSLIFCGVCGHRLNKTDSKDSYFYCRKMKNLEEQECSKTKMTLNFLCSEVLDSLKLRVDELIEMRENLPKDSSSEKNTSELVFSIETTKADKKKVYESFVNAELSKKEYLKEKERLEIQIERLSIIYETALTQKRVATEDNNKLLSLNLIQSEILKATELSTELAKKYIKRVEIFPDDSLNIEYMFDNLF